MDMQQIWGIELKDVSKISKLTLAKSIAKKNPSTA